MYGFGQYIAAIFGVEATVVLGPLSLSLVKTIALAGGTFFTAVNYVGAKETGSLQNGIVILLVAILAVFTVWGTLEADPSNLPPSNGLGPMMATTGLIFVSYLGFVQITSVAEEIKEPGKNLPRAVIGSVLLVTTIYALVLVVMRTADPEDYEPDYRVPLYPIVPVLGAITSFALIYYIRPDAVLASVGLVAAAVVWYTFYARTRTPKQGILSHRGFEEVFDAARTQDADLAVMGWGEDAHGSPGRAESAIDEVAGDLPCDFLDLWAGEHDLEEADQRVETGDVEATIADAAADAALRWPMSTS